MRAYDLEVTGSLKVQGDIKAENYIVETTVTSMTQSFASGSSKFGDGALDTHQFTGSLEISGSRIAFDDGKQNIAIGINSIGASGFTGAQNIAIGENAMLDANGVNTAYNIVIGYNAGKSFGANNVNNTILIGRQAGMNINNGDASNTIAIGINAGIDITSGQRNLLIVSEAGTNISTSDDNTAIG